MCEDDNGWIIKINTENIDDLDTMLDSKGYKDLVDGK